MIGWRVGQHGGVVAGLSAADFPAGQAFAFLASSLLTPEPCVPWVPLYLSAVMRPENQSQGSLHLFSPSGLVRRGVSGKRGRDLKAKSLTPGVKDLLVNGR